MASYGGELLECWFFPREPREILGGAEDRSLPYKMVVFSVFLFFFLCGRPPSQLAHLAAAAAHPGTEG